MSRLTQTFECVRRKNRIALIGYFTAGEPDFEQSLEIIDTACEAGLDVLELGIPCSDPFMDGPVIRMAHENALAAGMTVEKVFALVHRIRERHNLPVILMTYYQPIHIVGLEHFIQQAKESRIDGMLIVDLTEEYISKVQQYIDRSKPFHWIRFITSEMNPFQQERILQQANGFIYVASRQGVTGTGIINWDLLSEKIAAIRQKTSIPLCIGFGISTPNAVHCVAKIADGVIIGSAFQKLINKNSNITLETISGSIRNFRIHCESQKNLDLYSKK